MAFSDTLNSVDTVQPEEREAILAALARPVATRQTPLHVRHIMAARELAELARSIGRERWGLGLPTIGMPTTPQPRKRSPWRHWPNCRHTYYHLSCLEFEMLDGEADGFCDICRGDFRDARRAMHIDHDHAIGPRAVRGLLCASCNLQLSSVDVGLRPPDRDMANYLSDPWHARVGLGALTCPVDCGNSAHGNTPPIARRTSPAPRPTSAQQRRYLLAQLRASA